MSQCVPIWDLDQNPSPPRLTSTLRPHSNSNPIPPADIIPMLDYEVAELTWENGQLAMHGLGPPRGPNNKLYQNTNNWDKPGAGGTLESIVNQATCYLPPLGGKPASAHAGGGGDELVPWFDRRRAPAASASATMTLDALVPCASTASGSCRGQGTASAHVMDGRMGARVVVGCSTRVGSCSGANTRGDDEVVLSKRAAAQEWSCGSRDNNNHNNNNSNVDGSGGTCGRDDSWQLTLDTCDDRELGTVGGGFTAATSMGTSLENTTNSSGMQSTKATTDDHDSVCHSRSQKREAGNAEKKKKGGGKSSVSARMSKAAATHNQSERKRRDKINQRMKTLQKLVPNSSKTDKASMLDEVIEYLKQLQAQINMMSRMNMPSMMMPMTTLQQQLQYLAMMTAASASPMGMGMGCMDINTLGRHNVPGCPPMLHPAATAFMPLTSWDGTGSDRLPAPAGVIPDPMSTFLACQSMPMTKDAYSRMAALYQQMHQPPPSGANN